MNKKISVEIIHTSGKAGMKKALEDYLNSSEKELVDIKFSTDEYGYHVMVIERY